ncbi:MAG TPA: hypothetical protein VF691_14015, partial [Cytophagaceae bacterium]
AKFIIVFYGQLPDHLKFKYCTAPSFLRIIKLLKYQKALVILNPSPVLSLNNHFNHLSAFRYIEIPYKYYIA